ncbi:TetR family transcriptional regulator [Solemya pervernicosa gill symbiont]|uniref:TetR family transcriptional regulator n=2 Tax=Gammaproteobacteria incertae sedis TaxID=118884 RepID=A0A1T2L1A4_9GAMM|nr:TetR/AcrR family transcriptional regulator [Candidatus Reidiella endopervernicosa]OOZ38877.1 TetR family transcriptional regulator [Solemya pervernicosa gill symbiont]QKQ25147.1 TetR/AcrR family transcriptional regulator [Candidatus Reidiella endopervernicosa]
MSSEKPDTREQILQATWKLMEQRVGKSIGMSDVAKATGISRQAVYLHFSSRTELMIATSNYVDEVKGLNQRLSQFEKAKTGLEMMDACVEVWGEFMPEIYGIAKALLSTRDTDQATAAAWNNNMRCLRDYCRAAIDRLDDEGKLAPEWSREEATEIFWTLISINNWEQLTIECGWSNEKYIERMKALINRTLVNSPH